MRESKHTPTPWRISEIDCGFEIADMGGRVVVQVQQVKPASDETGIPERKANAAFIIRCVNSQQHLVDALEEISTHFYDPQDYARAALEKARNG